MTWREGPAVEIPWLSMNRPALKAVTPRMPNQMNPSRLRREASKRAPPIAAKTAALTMLVTNEAAMTPIRRR